jgi:hypothetical protein
MSPFIILFTVLFHTPFPRSCTETKLQKIIKKNGLNKGLNYFLYTLFILKMILDSRLDIGHTSTDFSLFISVIQFSGCSFEI